MGENIETFLAQLGNRVDKQTGAVSAPIHLSTTYSHPLSKFWMRISR